MAFQKEDKMGVFLSRFLAVCIILCGLFIAFLPTMMSSDWGRNQVVHWINRSIPGSLEIQRLNLHWGKGQDIEGLILKDPEGKAILEVNQISTEAALWHLTRKSLSLGATQIRNLNATVVTDEQGITNLQRALGIGINQEKPSLSPSTIILSNVNVESELFIPNRPLSAQIKGLTRQGNLEGSFDIQISLKGLRHSDWKQLKEEAQNYLTVDGSKEAKIQAQVINFPVDLIDRLAALQNPSLNGLFHSLLGDRLNINLNKEPSQEGLAFNLTLLAPLMQGDVKGLVKRGILSLTEPAVFHLNLSPESINAFIGDQVQLMNPSRLEIIFSNLLVPLNFFSKEGSADPCLFGFKANAKFSEIDLKVPSMGPLKVLNFQSHLTSLPCDKLIQIEVIGQAQQDQAPFDLHFTSKIDKPSNFSQAIQQMRQSMRSTLTISRFPLRVLPLFREHPEWSEKFGSSINAQLDLYPNKEDWIGTFSFQTPHIVLREAQFNIGKTITLVSPAQLDWTLPSDGLSTLLNDDKYLISQPSPLNFVLKQFQIPLENLQLTKIQLESIIPHLQFPKLSTWGVIQFDQSLLKVEGQNLSQFHSHLTGQLSLLNSNGTPSPLVPEPLEFTQTSEWKIMKEGIDISLVQLQLDNSITHLHAEGEVNSNYLLNFTQPIQIQYTLSPSALKTLSHLLDKDWPALQESAVFDVNIDPREFDLKSFSLSNFYLQGLMRVKKIVLEDPSNEIPILEDMVIPWVIDGPRNNIYTNIKGLALSRKEKIPSQVSVHLQFWLMPGYYDIEHMRTEMRMNFTGMPTSLINMALGIPDLNLIVGPIVDLNFKTFFDPTNAKPGYSDIILDSSNFHVEGRFKLDKLATLYDPKKLPTIRLTVTPESYQQLKKIFHFQDERQLAAPFTITAVLADLNLPLKHSWTERGIFDFKLATTDIQWKDYSTPWKLEGHLSTKNLMNEVNFLARAESKMPLTLEGTLTNLFDKESRLRRWQEMGIHAKLNGQQLTPSFLQNLLPLSSDQKQKFQALFGETFDIQLTCQLKKLNGSVQAFAKGSQGNLQLDGQIKEGILTLNKPLEASVKMTPLFTQIFLAQNVPLLSTAIGAENPITFAIEPSQFACPLVPFQIERIKIGKGTLDLGKLHFRNEGELGSTLNLIRPLSGPELTIWFTPIYIELDRGILSLKRFDMLVAHAYTLANWGSINLINHQAHFVLGLSAQTLQHAFGIQGLDEKYILQVPLHSAKGKVEIDKKKATARISALVAQSHGGSAGKLLGNLVDLALSEKGESYPPPTTHPFPWQGEFNPQPQQQQKGKNVKTEKTFPASSDASSQAPEQDQDKPIGKKKKKKHKLLEDENLKDLQEGAIQLLDQWLSR